MIYVAFLQGINVGKHNRIPMSELKRVLDARGLKNVQTYLQNGNVIFESEQDGAFLKKMIEHELMITNHYVVPVIIRTLTELIDVIKNCPFSKEKMKEARDNTGEVVYIAFLNKIPSSDKLELIKEYRDSGVIDVVIDRHVYLLFLNQRLITSKLVRNITKLDVYATIRDWNTINKLITIGKKIAILDEILIKR